MWLEFLLDEVARRLEYKTLRRLCSLIRIRSQGKSTLTYFYHVTTTKAPTSEDPNPCITYKVCSPPPEALRKVGASWKPLSAAETEVSNTRQRNREEFRKRIEQKFDTVERLIKSRHSQFFFPLSLTGKLKRKVFAYRKIFQNWN